MIRHSSAVLALATLLVTGNASALTRISESRVVKADQDVRAISEAVEQFKNDIGRYPTTDEGLSVLVTPTDSLKGSSKYKPEGYVRRLPRDPWGNDYRYLSPGRNNPATFDLWTQGADGEEGGEGINGNFGNWPGSFDSWYESERRKGRNEAVLYSFLYGVPIGICVGLPVFLVGFIKARRAGLPTKVALKGFHLGVLLYLAALIPAIGTVLVLIF